MLSFNHRTVLEAVLEKFQLTPEDVVQLKKQLAKKLRKPETILTGLPRILQIDEMFRRLKTLKATEAVAEVKRFLHLPDGHPGLAAVKHLAAVVNIAQEWGVVGMSLDLSLFIASPPYEGFCYAARFADTSAHLVAAGGRYDSLARGKHAPHVAGMSIALDRLTTRLRVKTLKAVSKRDFYAHIVIVTRPQLTDLAAPVLAVLWKLPPVRESDFQDETRKEEKTGGKENSKEKEKLAGVVKEKKEKEKLREKEKEKPDVKLQERLVPITTEVIIWPPGELKAQLLRRCNRSLVSHVIFVVRGKSLEVVSVLDGQSTVLELSGLVPYLMSTKFRNLHPIANSNKS